MRKLSFILYIITICVLIFLSARPIIDGNINFHTDIARDFLLLEDVYYNHNISLIGPRAGGIPGVFHGPLWIYLNLPAYALGVGNPIAVGWFWIGLFILSIGVIYYVSIKMFDRTTAMIATIVYASAYGTSIPSFFNPTGAVIIAPLLYYALWKYFKTNKWLWLVASLFTIGCIIQFQMAFGVPLLVVMTPFILYRIWKMKNIKHLFAFAILAIPLSSYILFELRHDFLQIKAILNYLTGVENLGKEDETFTGLIYKRFNMLMGEVIGIVTHYVSWLTTLVLVSISFGISRGIKKVSLSNKYVLFALLYLGYWIVIFPYKGVVWGYYYVPFVGLISIIFAASYKHINKYLFAIIFLSIFFNNFRMVNQPSRPDDIHQGTWKFYKSIAEQVYKDAPPEFGYYTFTTDQFGYSSQYAMHYMNRQFKNKVGIPFEKKKTTYLLIDDPGTHPAISSLTWRLYDVKISSEMSMRTDITDTYKIEKYILTEEELKEPSNPYMLNSLIFR